MLIQQITLARLNIPLIRPFITALRRTEQVEDIVVIIQSDSGLVGYGSAAATPVITGDSSESILSAIQLIAPQLIAKDVANFEELLLLIQNSLVNNSSAKAALDIAIHDLVAKSMHVPLYKFLGGGRPELKILTTISVKDSPAMVKDAERFVAQGFSTLKIKVGLDPAEDIARILAIAQAVGDKIQLVTDANQGWNPKAALQVIDSLVAQQINLALIEQPVKAWDYAGLKYVRDNSRIPIYADESAFNLQDVTRIVSGQLADGINLKLMKSGGLYAARAIYALASSYNLPCMAGCMLESPIGLAAMASLVVGRSNIKFVDLDPITMLKSNPVHGGLALTGATVSLADAPGLGISQIDGLQILALIK